MQISCKHEACRGIIKLFFSGIAGALPGLSGYSSEKDWLALSSGVGRLARTIIRMEGDALPSFAMRLRQTHLFFGLNLWLLLAAGIAHAQAPRPLEYQLKAAFLYNFAIFIEWPPEAFKDGTSPLFFFTFFLRLFLL